MPYVDALGPEDAEFLFLKLGGSQAYLPAKRSQERGLLVEVLGDPEKVMALSRAFGADEIGAYIKIPVASEWIAIRMRRRGVSTNEIARMVRADVATVRRWFSATTNRALVAGAEEAA